MTYTYKYEWTQFENAIILIKKIKSWESYGLTFETY